MWSLPPHLALASLWQMSRSMPQPFADGLRGYLDAALEVRLVGGLADFQALHVSVAVADLPAQSVVGHAVQRFGPVGHEMHGVGVVA